MSFEIDVNNMYIFKALLKMGTIEVIVLFSNVTCTFYYELLGWPVT